MALTWEFPVPCHRVDSEYYDDMSKGEVQKGYYYLAYYSDESVIEQRNRTVEEVVG